MLRFELLGPVAVRADGEPLPIGPPLRRTLLALLLVERDRTVSVDRITDALWEDEPPARPEASVQAMMSHLRRVVEPGRGAGGPPTVLRTLLPGYRLTLPADAGFDVAEFRADAEAARTALDGGDPVTAGLRARAALDRWSGTALSGTVDVGFVRDAVEGLEELRLGVRQVRCEAALAVGDHREVLGELDALTRAHPYRESLWRLLVLALYRDGRTVAALDRYRAFAGGLADELGLDPGREIQDLQARILRQDPALDVSPARAVVARPAPAEPPAVAAPSAPEPAAAPVHGRRRELDILGEVVTDLTEGRSPLLVVGGAAGIGKSTLMTELGRSARAAGVRVGWGRCHEDVDVGALWPVLSAAADAGVQLPPDATGSAAFPLIGRALRAQAALRPLLLVVEDLHWAGAETLRLLSFLAVDLAAAPVALAVTHRPGEGLSHQVGLLATLSRQPGSRRLELDELDATASRAVAAGAVGGRMGDDDLDLVLTRAGGNPFFLGETARLVADGDREGLPGGVRSVVLRRLQGLPAPVVSVLQAGAVLGTRFDLPVLADVLDPTSAGRIGDDLLDAVQTGLDRTVLVEVADRDAGFAFTHAVVRDAVLDSAGALVRRRWHARAAAVLPRHDARTEATAHHLLEGLPLTDRAAAVDAATAAGLAADAELAHDTAAYWFGRATAALPGDADVVRLDLSVRRARSLARASAMADLRPCLLTAFDLATARRDLRRLAELTDVVDLSGGIWFWVDFGTVPTDLLDRLERAYRVVLTEPGGTAVAARLAGTLAVGRYYVVDDSGDPSDVLHAPSVELADHAVELAARSGDRTALTAALGQLVRVLWRPDTHDRQHAVADRLLALVDVDPDGEPSTDPTATAAAMNRLAAWGARSTARGAAGDVDGADDDCRAALTLARRHRLGGAVTQLLWQRVGMAVARGDLAGGVELSREAVQIQERTQLYQQENLQLMSASEIALRDGSLAGWGELLRVIGDRPGLPTGWLAVESALLRGDPVAAWEQACGTLPVGPQPHWLGWLACLCIEARALAAVAAHAGLGDGPTPRSGSAGPLRAHAAAVAARCAETATHLAPYAGRHAIWGSMLWLGPVDSYRGRLAAVAGDLPTARTLLRSALRQARAAGLVAVAADTAEALDRVLPLGADAAAERRDLLAAVTAWQQEQQLATPPDAGS